MTLDGAAVKANCIKAGSVVEVYCNPTLNAWFLQYVSITVDTVLSALSFNAISNNAVAAGLFYKANTTEVNAALALKSDKTETQFNATNLVTNGDFSGGTTGWTYTSGSISASDGVLAVTPTAQYGSGRQTIANHTSYRGHKLYAMMSSKVDSLSVSLQVNDGASGTNFNHTIVGAYEKISTIHTVSQTSSTLVFVLQDTRASGWTSSYINYAMVVDLTATFGIGNEPTATEMDKLLSYYPNSWFNSTVNLCDNRKFAPYLVKRLGDLEAQKADKAQEAWITPTLVNGWKARAGYQVAYCKDDFGCVRLKGVVDSGSGGFFAILAIGYRPSQMAFFPCRVVTGTTNSTGMLQVETNGNMSLITTLSEQISLDSVTFKIS